MKWRKLSMVDIIVKSPPSRGAWIEMPCRCLQYWRPPSPPSRGAWIEIDRCWLHILKRPVAPLAGGVD